MVVLPVYQGDVDAGLAELAQPVLGVPDRRHDGVGDDRQDDHGVGAPESEVSVHRGDQGAMGIHVDGGNGVGVVCAGIMARSLRGDGRRPRQSLKKGHFQPRHKG